MLAAVRALPDDLYALGYDAGVADTLAEATPGPCPRCSAYTTEELASLERDVVTVGPFTWRGGCRVWPLALDQALSAREYDLLRLLLRAWPQTASWATLVEADGADAATARHNVRVIAYRLRRKLAPYGWTARPDQERGYRLREGA